MPWSSVSRASDDPWHILATASTSPEAAALQRLSTCIALLLLAEGSQAGAAAADTWRAAATGS